MSQSQTAREVHAALYLTVIRSITRSEATIARSRGVSFGVGRVEGGGDCGVARGGLITYGPALLGVMQGSVNAADNK